MKITFLNEAGVFGSYKKATAKSNVDNAKRELAREAKRYILEKRCDELAELYLDMLNEVNSHTSAISSKYEYNIESGDYSGLTESSNLKELSNYVPDKYFRMSNKKEIQLNIIKNVYCNKLAIEYMVSKGCFILPLIDTERTLSFFNDTKEIISYKNMVKTVAAAAEKVIKSHISKFPNYAATVPNTVKIIVLQDDFIKDFNYTIHFDTNHKQFLSYMGVTGNEVEFEYPVGNGSACLNYILDNYTVSEVTCTILPVKSEESVWKALAEPSPWMFNKITLTSIKTDMYTVSANNFYGIKILKFAGDNGLLSNNDSCIRIKIDNVIKNLQFVRVFKQEVSNNGLDKNVEYNFINTKYVNTRCKIGKEITPEQAKQEGISIDCLKRRKYEFDYNNTTEVKSAAKEIIESCLEFITDTKIKKLAEDKMEKYLPVVMNKVAAANPDCLSSSNKIVLCNYLHDTNIGVFIDTNKLEINKKGNLVFYIGIDFSVYPVRKDNPKYNNGTTTDTSEKNYVHITGKKIKIEIPL